MSIRTIVYSSLIEEPRATSLFLQLKAAIPWVDGIYSSKARKITRKAHAMGLDPASEEEMEILMLITEIVSLLNTSGRLEFKEVDSIYLNYYRNGSDWAPAHAHPGQVQLVISLGQTRQLKVGTKIYPLSNGDVIVFGSSTHEVIREPEITEPRISIAVFLNK